MEVELLECVECGNKFDPLEAEYMSEVTSSVRCPFCGRANYWEGAEIDGLHVEIMDEDKVLEETEEPYIEGYLSKDLVYDGINRYDVKDHRRIGAAKRNKKYVPTVPMLEIRKVVAEALLEIEEKNKDEFHTRTRLEELLYRKRLTYEP